MEREMAKQIAEQERNPKAKGKEGDRNMKFDMLQNKKLVLFGAGQRGEKLLELFRNIQIEPSCFCDNKEEKWGKELNQLPILSLDSLLQSENLENLLFFISLNPFVPFYQEVESQLKKAGVTGILSPSENLRTWFVLSSYQEVKEGWNLSPSDIKTKLEANRTWFTEEQSLQTFDVIADYRFREDISEGEVHKRLCEIASPLCKEFLATPLPEKFYFSLKISHVESASKLIFVGMDEEAEENYKKLSTSSFFAEKNLMEKNIYFCPVNQENTATSFMGYPVLSKEEVLSSYLGQENFFIFLGDSFIYEIFRYTLHGLGVIRKNCSYISLVADWENQYFEKEILSLGKDEIFVDVGVEDGSSSICFASFVQNNYQHIYLFEPNQTSVELAKERLAMAEISNYTLEPFGLWNQKDTLKFGGFSGNFRVVQEGEESLFSLEVDTLDHLLDGKPVTFIKMDIEGSELPALEGAKETILAHKPKLAICVYHKASDLLTIPAYLKSLVPEYRFFLRHYNTNWSETVLFALHS